MTSPALIIRNGVVRELPRCQQCGRPIVAPGICVLCAKLPDLQPIKVVLVKPLIEPGDL